MRIPSALAVAAALFLPVMVAAQEAPPPEIRYISVTRFERPDNQADAEQVRAYLEQVMVAQAKINPNILSYRVGGHSYGSRGREAVIIAEYPNWAAINGECQQCVEWMEANRPAEGTPERAAWDARAETFFKYYMGHQDEIYAVNMSTLAK